MCGRFTQAYTWAEIRDAMDLMGPPPDNLRPRYNIAPTTTIDVVVDRGAGRELVKMMWWFVPRWAKPDAKNPDKPETKIPTFNARLEEIEAKPMFRGAWADKRRCIIPASGFYEWTGEKKDRQPHYFTRADGKIVAFAGLWTVWKNPTNGQDIETCTLITHEPSRWMRRFHNRMPAILEEKDFDAWLTGRAGKEVLQPAPEDALREWKVSTRMNAPGVGDDDTTTIDPI